METKTNLIWGDPGQMSALPPPPPSKTLDSKKTAISGDSYLSIAYEKDLDPKKPIDKKKLGDERVLSFQRRADDLRDISIPKETPINNTIRDINIKLDKILNILEKSHTRKSKSVLRKAKSAPKPHTRKANSAPKPHTRKAKSAPKPHTRKAKSSTRKADSATTKAESATRKVKSAPKPHTRNAESLRPISTRRSA